MVLDKEVNILFRSRVSSPKVSVIVPSYNMSEKGFLVPCIESLLGQTLDEIEIIYVDDASTDDSVDVLSRYANRHSNITVLSMNENGKQGAARNWGLEEARGEYIGFVDGDDFVSPDFYESLYVEAKKTGCDLVEGGLTKTDSFGVPIGAPGYSLKDEMIEDWEQSKEAFVLNHPPFLSCLFARRVFESEAVRFPEGIFYEDTALIPVVFSRIGSVARAGNGTYYYRQNSESTIHGAFRDRKMLDDRLKSSSLILENAKKVGVYDEFEGLWNYYYAQVAYVNTLRIIAWDSDDFSKSELLGLRSRVFSGRKILLGRNGAFAQGTLKWRLTLLLALFSPSMFCGLKSSRQEKSMV